MQNSFKLKNECNLILFWNQVCVQKHVFEHENHFLSLQFMRSKENIIKQRTLKHRKWKFCKKKERNKCSAHIFEENFVKPALKRNLGPSQKYPIFE